MIISNENDLIKWEKDSCHNYTFTNKGPYEVYFTITEETTDELEPVVLVDEVRIMPGDNFSYELPSDGVYKVCAQAVESVVEEEILPSPVAGNIYVYKIEESSLNRSSRIKFLDGEFNGTPVTLYDYNSDPNFNVDFNNTPSSLFDFISTVQGILNTLGGQILFANPGESVFGYPPTDAGVYTFYISTPINLVLNKLNLYIFFDDVSQLVTPEVDCVYIFPESQLDYITDITYNGENILDQVYLQSCPTTPQNIIDAILYFLNENGGGHLLSDSTGNAFVSYNCVFPETITFANLERGELYCDYIYDLCDLYNCLVKFANDWLCNESGPCEDHCGDCDYDIEDRRRRLMDLSNLFFLGLMPLITADRLNFIGDFDVPSYRFDYNKKIVDLYSKIKERISLCDSGCFDDELNCGC